MKNVRPKKSTNERAASKRRKNARPDERFIVVPKGGVETLLEKIGDPFSPLDFRKLIERARQVDPSNVDQGFRKLVKEETAKQITALLIRLGLEPTDPNVHRHAFLILAIALCGVGQVAWTPAPRQSGGWTQDNSARLFWFVKTLRELDSLKEREAVRKIATDPFLSALLPYRPQNLKRAAQLTPQKRRVETLWQAWMKIKRQEKQFLAAGRPEFVDAIGKKMGAWEVLLVTLDADHSLPPLGKSRAR